MAIQPSTLNHRMSTPNKLFESLAAGTPVVASDFPEMRSIVLDDPRGALGAVCVPMTRDVARAIGEIVGQADAERDALRARCLAAAHERWNWQAEADALLDLYRSLEPAPVGGTSHRMASR